MKKWTASVLVLSAGCLWGTLGLFARQLAAAGLGSFETTAMRLTVAGLVGGMCLLAYNQKLFRVQWKDLWCFVGSGVASMLLFSVFYFTGLRYTSLAVASVLVYTAPIFVMVISLRLFHERLNSRKLAALAAAFLGCVLVSGVGTGQAVTAQGFLLCLAAGFFFSLYSIFGKLASQRGYHPLTTTFYSFFFGALGCAVLADWGAVAEAVRIVPAVLPWMVGTGIITAFLPYVMYSAGLGAMEPSKASILATTELVTEAVIGGVVYHEGLTVGMLAGILLILSAVVLLNLTLGRKQVSY